MADKVHIITVQKRSILFPFIPRHLLGDMHGLAGEEK